LLHLSFPSSQLLHGFVNILDDWEKSLFEFLKLIVKGAVGIFGFLTFSFLCISFNTSLISIDGRDYLSVTNIIRETTLFNRKITFSTASCYSFVGRGMTVSRDETIFSYVLLSEALNRLVNEHQFLILIANERTSSIIHHDGAFFLFDPHSMDQYGTC
uniref:Peptidase C76 domain-containing protein n=1 Tax=Strongyloides papillosus TaxID=174720 RepID=A0A0N5BMS4_STREA